MTIDEIIAFAKILVYASGDKSVTVSEAEKQCAASALKRMADQRMDWTQEQRERYKTLVDAVEYMSGDQS